MMPPDEPPPFPRRTNSTAAAILREIDHAASVSDTLSDGLIAQRDNALLEVARLRASQRALVEAIKGLMRGSIYRAEALEIGGVILPPDWVSIRMPDSSALQAARVALAAAEGEQWPIVSSSSTSGSST